MLNMSMLAQKALYPKEFRIPKPEFNDEQLLLLEELIQLMMPTVSQADTVHRQEKRHLSGFLADLGTGVWRIRQRVSGIKTIPKELQEAIYSLESMWNSMTEEGVDIVDHMGELPVGMVPKVIEIKDVPGLSREQVIQTVKPTITLKGEVVQVGEVIVGRPAPSNYAAEIPQNG